MIPLSPPPLRGEMSRSDRGGVRRQRPDRPRDGEPPLCLRHLPRKRGEGDLFEALRKGGSGGSELFRAFLEILNLTPNRPTAFVIPARFVGISLLPAQPTGVGWLLSGMPGLPLTIQMSSLSPRSIATLCTIKASPLAPASPALTTCGMRSLHLDATREVHRSTGPRVRRGACRHRSL